MKKNTTVISIAGICFLALLAVVGLIRSPVNDQPAAANESDSESRTALYYKGKNIRFIVPYDPGGGYDESARLIMPYLEKYTGARVDIHNLPGAGGMRGVNELYISPANGLTIGMLNGPALVTNQIAGVKGAEYRLEEFSYLGRIVADTRVLIVSSQSNYTSFDDIRNAREPVRIGTSGLGASAYVDAVISREAFNLNLHVIHGFDSSSVIRHSMLRGDVDGTWGSMGSAEDAVDSGHEIIILQSGIERIKELADVPTVFEMIDRTDNPERTRAILSAWHSLISVGRLVAAPPGIARTRLEFLRKAFSQALHDPDLLEAAQNARRPVQYASGEEINALINNTTEMDEDIKQLFISIIRGEL